MKAGEDRMLINEMISIARKYLVILYYYVKPFVPRSVQIMFRRKRIKRILPLIKDCWPIDYRSGKEPDEWRGWPESKKFALILTHDVENAAGQDKCMQLAEIEERLDFRSSFNFVPKRYNVSAELLDFLINKGFEIGVHGLYHDGKYFNSRKIFNQRAREINKYLHDWNAVGFRSPSMDNNLGWIRDLDILYDASTFDTDPFEPHPNGCRTIFPFSVSGNSERPGYVELPYTLPQDFTLFIMMREKNIDIWERKLDWIVEKGGMALLNTHPDYMNFNNGKLGREEYHSEYYKSFLEYVLGKYKGMYWHSLPKNLAKLWPHISRKSQQSAF